jgi:hypothetical protein
VASSPNFHDLSHVPALEVCHEDLEGLNLELVGSLPLQYPHELSVLDPSLSPRFPGFDHALGNVDLAMVLTHFQDHLLEGLKLSEFLVRKEDFLLQTSLGVEMTSFDFIFIGSTPVFQGLLFEAPLALRNELGTSFV